MVSPVVSPVRLVVSPAAASTPTGVFNQWFEALFPCAGTLGCMVCHLVYQLLPCWPAAALPTPLHNPPPCWVHQQPPCHESSPPSGPSSPLLPVWMNVSSFISLVVGLPYSLIFCQLWLFFFFLIQLLSLWLCEEAQCVYLCRHLGSPRWCFFNPAEVDVKKITAKGLPARTEA